MRKVIDMDGQSVELDSSAGWLFEYQEQFGHDILPDIMPLLEAVLDVIGVALPKIGSGKKEIALSDAAGIISELKDSDEAISAMVSLSGLETTTFYRIVWAMAKNNDNSIPEPKTWVKSFETFPMDTVLPKLLELIITSSLSAKNAKSLLAMFKEKSSQSKSSPSQESTEG